jgi:hypothetical protein
MKQAAPADAVSARGEASSSASTVISLVAANIFGLALGVWQGWDAKTFMLLYWGQSIAMGAFAAIRILALDKFSTEHEQLHGRRIPPTPSFKRGSAAFFVIWYSMLHGIILLGLFFWSPDEPLLTRWFWIATAGFALQQIHSCLTDIRRDRLMTPNIYRLTTIPYMRTLPPIITVALVGPFVGTTAGIVTMGILRTVVDVWMHLEAQAERGA